MEEKRLICIGCPMGCPLIVTMDGGEVVSVKGNTCKRGLRSERNDKSNKNRDFDSADIRRKHSCIVRKDKGRYSKRKDF